MVSLISSREVWLAGNWSEKLEERMVSLGREMQRLLRVLWWASLVGECHGERVEVSHHCCKSRCGILEGDVSRIAMGRGYEGSMSEVDKDWGLEGGWMEFYVLSRNNPHNGVISILLISG